VLDGATKTAADKSAAMYEFLEAASRGGPPFIKTLVSQARHHTIASEVRPGRQPSQRLIDQALSLSRSLDGEVRVNRHPVRVGGVGVLRTGGGNAQGKRCTLEVNVYRAAGRRPLEARIILAMPSWWSAPPADLRDFSAALRASCKESLRTDFEDFYIVVEQVEPPGTNEQINLANTAGLPSFSLALTTAFAAAVFSDRDDHAAALCERPLSLDGRPVYATGEVNRYGFVDPVDDLPHKWDVVGEDGLLLFPAGQTREIPAGTRHRGVKSVKEALGLLGFETHDQVQRWGRSKLLLGALPALTASSLVLGLGLFAIQTFSQGYVDSLTVPPEQRQVIFATLTGFLYLSCLLPLSAVAVAPAMYLGARRSGQVNFWFFAASATLADLGMVMLNYGLDVLTTAPASSALKPEIVQSFKSPEDRGVLVFSQIAFFVLFVVVQAGFMAFIAWVARKIHRWRQTRLPPNLSAT
jgi:hypothetical protein